MFIGSRFVSGSEDLSGEAVGKSIQGLPGTRNVFFKWGAEPPPDYRALRGSVIEERNKFISESSTIEAERAAASVASVSDKEVGRATEVIGRSHSLHAAKVSFMTAPNDLDGEYLVIGAWVFLDTNDFADRDMRTILANKKPGCENKEDQNGLALYVNSWQSSDHKLYVEYGGKLSGCHKVDSGSVTLRSNEWHHIAVALIGRTTSLFIDGKVVHSSDAAAEGHLVQTMQPLIVGQYPGHPEYSLFGNVSQLAVAHPSGPLEVNQVADLVSSMMKLSSNPSPSALRSLSSSSSSIFAFYPLTDAASEIPDGKAVELVQGRHGKYHFPLVKGVQFTGVPIPLIDGINGRPVTEAMKAESDALGKTRREEIKAAMSFVWGSYKKYAWGRDELKPISHQGQDNWGGMGVTLVDSLDTLWIMGLTKEFEEAKEWVRTRLTFSNAGAVSVFETTIRELGGLLSAYDLSKDKVFLDKAVELGGLLSAAFDSKTGIPYGMVNLQSGQPAQGWAGSAAILSELGTLQLEFRNLAMASHNKALEQKSMKVMQLMSTKNPQHGLFPIKVDINSGHWADTHVTFGALGDSFYEYLLKVWIQGGKKEMWLREMYDKAMDGVVNVLLKASDMTGLAFLSDWNGHSNIRKMDHLVCFMPGTLALGAHTDPLGPDSPRSKRDLAIAKALMYTCREMYHRMKSGISPEYVEFPPGQDMIVGTTAPFYILRPETAESLFILNQLTGDPIYRDWAWEIFSAIEKHCKIPGGGYGALQDVNRPDRGVDDRMESFFLAETVKYLYLAQDPDRPIDLDHFVFNTEAHPTRVFDPEKHEPIAAA